MNTKLNKWMNDKENEVRLHTKLFIWKSIKSLSTPKFSQWFNDLTNLIYFDE